MQEGLALWLKAHGLPAELVVLVISTLPIFELRGGIPLGAFLELAWWKTYLMAVIGNLIPVVPLLLFLNPVSNWFRRHI